MKQYKMGIVGLGDMSRYHIWALEDKGYERVIIKGVYDINGEKYEFANKKGYHIYSSYEDMLSDDEIDIVLIATSNEVHKELSIKALEAGKNVLCEKPVTPTSAELLEIMSVAEKSGKVFTIDQNRRVNKDFVLMKRCVESGMIGKPYIIESSVDNENGMPSGWRTIKRLGGGMLLDWGVHLLDQLMYMYDEKVVNVFCKMYKLQYPEVEDNFTLTITFESGLTAHIRVETNNFIKHPRWLVMGEKGTLKIDDWDCRGEVISTDEEMRWTDDVIYTSAETIKAQKPDGERKTVKTELTAPEDFNDSITAVYEQMIDAIEKKAELTIKPEQALRVIKVMEAAFESSEKSEAIKTNI